MKVRKVIERGSDSDHELQTTAELWPQTNNLHRRPGSLPRTFLSRLRSRNSLSNMRATSTSLPSASNCPAHYTSTPLPMSLDSTPFPHPHHFQPMLVCNSVNSNCHGQFVQSLYTVRSNLSECYLNTFFNIRLYPLAKCDLLYKAVNIVSITHLLQFKQEHRNSADIKYSRY